MDQSCADEETNTASIKTSCLVAVQNMVRTVERCLSSILKENFDEVVVVDGGSTDGTSQVIDKFPVIHVYDKGKNVSSARNMGLREVTGYYIVLIDGDQWIQEGFGRKLKAILRRKQWDVLFCNEVFVGSSSWAKAFQEIWIQVSAFGHNYIPRPKVFSRSIISAVGGYDESFTSFEDADMWNRIKKLRPSVCKSELGICNDVQSISVLSQFRRGIRHNSCLPRFLKSYPTEWMHVVGTAPIGFLVYLLVAARVLARTHSIKIAFAALVLRFAWSIGLLVGLLVGHGRRMYK